MFGLLLFSVALKKGGIYQNRVLGYANGRYFWEGAAEILRRVIQGRKQSRACSEFEGEDEGLHEVATQTLA